jgi:hypothetical protein
LSIILLELVPLDSSPYMINNQLDILKSPKSIWFNNDWCLATLTIHELDWSINASTNLLLHLSTGSSVPSPLLVLLVRDRSSGYRKEATHEEKKSDSY